MQTKIRQVLESAVIGRRRIRAANDTMPITDPDLALQANAKLLPYLGMVWISALMVNIAVAAKLFDLGPASFSVAVLFYPVTYIFSDIFTEVYGYRQTRRIVWAGLVMLFFASMAFYACVWVPPSQNYADDAAFRAVFSTSPLISAAAIVAFWAGEMTNSIILAKMKIWTGGRLLWARTSLSSLGGQFVDALAYYFIAYGFSDAMGVGAILNLCVSTALFCMAYELLATPVTYRIIAYLKRAEGMDVYDRGTTFNPFSVS